MREFVFYLVLFGWLAGLSACVDEREPDFLPPLLQLGEAKNITRTSARVEGTISWQGSGKVFESYFLYDTTDSFISSKRLVADGMEGLVGVDLDSLVAGADYYYYLEISNGYNVLRTETGHFRTVPNSPPLLDKTVLVSKGPTSAVVRGKLLDDGGVDLTYSGFKYQEEGSNEVTFVPAEVTGDSTMRVRLTGLTLSTRYRVWACAANTGGETVADTVHFFTDYALSITEAGTLSEVIGEDEKYTLTEISVTGELNGTDIRFLREMLGRDVEGKETPGKLQILDLSDAAIVAGGMSYYSSNYTEENIVGNTMFQDCGNLLEIRLPNRSTVIEDAFSGCTSLEVLTLPDALQVYTASTGCGQLKEFRVSELNRYFLAKDGVLLDKSGKTLLCYPAGKNVDTYTIPDGVETVAERAFLSAAIGVLHVPASVSKLGISAFAQSALREVVLGETIREIPKAAFQDCRQLTTVTLGRGVWNLASSCFAGCPLQQLTVLADVSPACMDTAFDEAIFSTCLLYVPLGSEVMYRNSPVWKKFPRVIGVE